MLHGESIGAGDRWHGTAPEWICSSTSTSHNCIQRRQTACWPPCSREGLFRLLQSWSAAALVQPGQENMGHHRSRRNPPFVCVPPDKTIGVRARPAGSTGQAILPQEEGVPRAPAGGSQQQPLVLTRVVTRAGGMHAPRAGRLTHLQLLWFRHHTCRRTQ